MFLSRSSTLMGCNASPRTFPEKVSRELVAHRREPLLSAVEKAAQVGRLRGEQLRDHQAQSIRELLEQAYQHVPFYRAKYQHSGFVPEDFRSLDDLRLIPLVDKAEWRSATLDALRNRHTAHEAAWLLSSSGSTGVPSRIFRDSTAMWRFMARNLESFRQWSQPRAFESCLYLIDFAPGSIDFLIADLLRTTVPENRIVASSRRTEEHLAALRKFHPDFLSSYPSTIRNVAMALDRRREIMGELRMLHLTSEMLDRRTRGLLTRVFPNAKVIESYTSTEAGLIAQGCPVDGRLHLVEEGVVCEIVDSHGKPTDELGEMVVTDLTNHATPVLRYRGLGDFARWESSPCGCGSPYRAIRQLEGRVTDSILTSAGEWLSPYAVIDILEDLPGIYQFQIVQRSVREILVRVVRDPTSNVEEVRIADAIRSAVTARLPNADCLVEFAVHILPETGRHKVPLVVSHLSAAHAARRPA